MRVSTIHLNLQWMSNAFSLCRHWYTGHTGEMASDMKYSVRNKLQNKLRLVTRVPVCTSSSQAPESNQVALGGGWGGGVLRQKFPKKEAYKVKSRAGLCLILYSGERSAPHTSAHLWGAYITITQTVRRYAHNSSIQVKFNAGEFKKQKIRRAFQFRLKSHISLTGDCTTNNTKITESWSICSYFKFYVIHLLIWRN
jgi:hypothetical protein